MGGMSNPLLDFQDLPLFDAVRPDQVSAAMDELLKQADAALAKVTADDFPADWQAMSRELDVSTEKLGRAWGAVGHLNAVADTPELRAAYNENLPKITEFWTSLSQNLALFDKYKALRAGDEYAAYSPARKKIIENALRDFRLGGAELPEEKKERFAEIQEQQAAL